MSRLNILPIPDVITLPEELRRELCALYVSHAQKYKDVNPKERNLAPYENDLMEFYESAVNAFRKHLSAKDKETLRQCLAQQRPFVEFQGLSFPDNEYPWVMHRLTAIVTPQLFRDSFVHSTSLTEEVLALFAGKIELSERHTLGQESQYESALQPHRDLFVNLNFLAGRRAARREQTYFITFDDIFRHPEIAKYKSVLVGKEDDKPFRQKADGSIISTARIHLDGKYWAMPRDKLDYDERNRSVIEGMKKVTALLGRIHACSEDFVVKRMYENSGEEGEALTRIGKLEYHKGDDALPVYGLHLEPGNGVLFSNNLNVHGREGFYAGQAPRSIYIRPI
jgi:hypothetical protein